MISKFMYTIHRILGTLFSVLFLIWFLSAFVMMYHGFPRVSQAEKLEKLEPLTSSLPSVREITSRLQEKEQVKEMYVNRHLGQTLFHIRTDREAYKFPADSTASIPVLDEARIHLIAGLWCNAPVEKIDTLVSLDQWIPFGSLKKEFPIYKFHFDDAKKHQLYISSQSGEVLQFTTRSERVWAWLGPIPHWMYFTWLRQDSSLWKTTVIWLSGLGCLMVIAGLWVGIKTWTRTRKRKHTFSPYRKKWYHWHYVTGMVFGLFVLTFCFSGMMSLADVPAWISQPSLQKNPIQEIRNHAPDVNNYVLDYRQVLKKYPDARQLEWSNFRSRPYYIVKRNEGDVYVDATDTLCRPLKMTEEQIVEAIEAIHGDSVRIQAELIHAFETHYRDKSRTHRNRSLLPVWKVTVDDADRSCYYIHPETGNVNYVNNTARWKYRMYTALHRLRIRGLNSSPILRKGILWVLLLGGTACSLSGVVLGIRYLQRLYRKR